MKQSAMLLAAALLLMPIGSAFARPGETSATASEDGEETPSTRESVEPQRQLVVYYFHGTRRCKTCLYIESTAHDIVSSRFAAELESGEMAWKVVNYDEPENEHFLKDFGLVSSSLVLVEMMEGRPVSHEVLQEAWTLAREKPAFKHYIERSILKHLGSEG